MNHKMVDMQMSKGERMGDGPKVQRGTDNPKSNKPEYPYGLRLDLNNEELDKLGIDLADFNQGDEVMIVASCSVVGKSESVSDFDKDVRQSLTLQVEKIGFGDEEADDGTEGEEEDGGERGEDDDLAWDEEASKVDRKLKKKGYA